MPEKTEESLLATAIAKVHYCDQPGEHSKHELITALCRKYLKRAKHAAMLEAAEIVRNRATLLQRNNCKDTIREHYAEKDLLTAAKKYED